MKWQQEIFNYLQAENYQAVSNFYEELIGREPKKITNYWLLGLAYLLEGREEEANATWLSLMAEGEETDELLEILEEEAERQKNHKENCYLIRKYIQELAPDKINNLLSLLQLELQLNTLSLEYLQELNLPDILNYSVGVDVNSSILYSLLAQLIAKEIPEITDILEASLPYLEKEQNFLDNAFSLSLKVAHKYKNIKLAITLGKIALENQPNDLYLINNLIELSGLSNDYDETLKFLELLKGKCQSKLMKIYADYRLIDFALKKGNWHNMEPINAKYLEDLQSLLLEEELDLAQPLVQEEFILMGIKLPYIQDKPTENRYFQNKISRLFQNHLQGWLKFPHIAITAERKQRKFPRIGYLSSTLGRNSVGWLSRWLFKYHNKEDFPIFLYLINQNEDDITEYWFRKNATKCYNLPMEPLYIAHQIQSDEIDILIDLDGLTRPVSCAVMALKPAPIQVSWLGFDATGIPNVDYFIVDPFVLPENAQNYYQEKLWRLPQTYLAVDGFEVATPTLTRKELNIPPDAVIYLTGQTGMKRYPETIKLQLKIIKEVPNSYLLIKGFAHLESVKELFLTLAKNEGIELERLRFLPSMASEEIHRANLTIADIVLDTYPYNGATTTLEVLWMGLPIVTLVGEQFAARNSYTFMLNAGITEGITSTPQEYIEWGVKLGLNEKLREKIHWKLLKNRETAPVWNAKLFTEQMEGAYLSMWQQYVVI